MAVALPELVRLGVLAPVAEGEETPPSVRAIALGRSAATVLRLVDRALRAHGRDTGYAVDAWHQRAWEHAHARAHAVSAMDAGELPLGTLVQASAEAAGDVVMALHRDRFGVPEGLADALGSLLVLFAAGT